MPTQYNYDQYSRGDDVAALVVTLTNEVGGTAVDLTGATARCHYRLGSALGELARRADTDDGLTILDPATDGKIQVDGFRADFRSGGDYHYDLEIEFPDLRRSTPLYGILPLREDVTK